MPTYDYLCSECGHTFEEFQSMSSELLRTCPSCGKPALKRLLGGGAGMIFKGSGFYLTDYKGNSGDSKKPSEKKPSEKKSSEKTESPDTSSGGKASETKFTETSSSKTGATGESKKKESSESKDSAQKPGSK